MAMGRRMKFMSIEMFLVVITILAVNTASSTAAERRRRHVISGSEGTSRSRPSTRSLDHSSPNSLTSGANDELGTEMMGKKVSHRLVGGHMRLETTTTTRTTTRPTTTMRSVSASRREMKDSRESSEENEEETDEATWDDGLVISSAGNGKEKKARQDEDDDEKKSLSQQVKEGKYGLIQNEIYPSRSKRPGIISYLSNSEVPKDNAKNLGGLDEEEIWLAENHVLVLRGGNFPDHGKDPHPISSNTDDWSPIDDYKAPKRQVKIPPRPEVPPPFPVQLTENGPVQILSVNGTACSGTCSEDETSSDENANKKFSPEHGKGKDSVVSKDPTSQDKKRDDKDQDRKIKSGHVPPRNGGIIGPFYPSLPPGAVFVVPPSNQSDYDEDDQSIYYPAPYSFYYKQENSTPVPPGPLVPGIILPPPPDFFSRLEDENESTTKQQHRTKYTKRPSTTDASPTPGAEPTYYPARKSVPKTYKGTTSRGSSSPVGKPATTKYAGSRGSSFTMKPVNGIKYKSTTGRSSSKKPIREPETVESSTKPYGGAKSTTSLEITEFYTARPNTLTNSGADETTTKSKSRWIASVSSKPVPLVTYYSSSTPSTIDRPVEVETTPPPGKDRNGGSSTPHQASYYFYEEANEEDTTVGTTPNPKVYHRATTETPPAFYRLQQQVDQGRVQEEKRSEYYFGHGFGRAQTQTPKTLEIVESLEPLEKTTLRYQSANSGVPATNSVEPTTRLKSQRMLTEVSPSYYDRITVRKRPHLQNLQNSQASYATTAKSTILSSARPKAIYQYSYESADYLKRRQENKNENYASENPSSNYYNEEKITQQQVAPTPEPFDEWQDIRVESQPEYDYEGEAEKSLPEQEIRAEIEDNRYGNVASDIEDTTASPHLAYYTKQDDQLLDDVTREYFTNFGKKIRGQSLPNTTPIYSYTDTRVVTDRPRYTQVKSYYLSNDYEDGTGAPAAPVYKTPRVRVHYGDQAQQRPFSLEGDTQVNYKNPLPSIDPDSEWIPGFDPKQKPQKPSLIPNYRQHQTQLDNQEFVRTNTPRQPLAPIIRNYDAGQRLIDPTNAPPTNFLPLGDSRQDAPRSYATTVRPPSLQADIDVNYRDPRPPINPDAEYIDPSALREPARNNNNNEKASYFAYRLPGDSGHFYFLTPQAITQRRDENGGYLYPRPRGSRFSRQRRRGARNS